MPKLFNRTDTATAKQTLAIFIEEILKDKRSVAIYVTLIPLNRLLYIVILPLLLSFVTQSLIVNPHDYGYPLILLAVAAIVSIAAVLTAFIGSQRLFDHEEKLRTLFLEKAMTSLMSHSDQFFSNQKVGSLAGNVYKFSDSILLFLDIIFLQAAGIIVNFTASLIIIAILSPILLIPLGLVTGLLVWRSIVGTAKRGPIRHKRKILTSQLNGTIADILGNQQIVRFFATDRREIQHVVKERLEIEAIAHREIVVLQREGAVRQSVLFAFQLLTLAISIVFFTHGLISIAALIFAITYLGRLTGSLFDISPIIRNTEQVFLDASEITGILQVTPEVVDAPHAPDLIVSKAEVEFRTVAFAYQDSKNQSVIRDMSFTVPAGAKIGLAGHSGGGKTTLTKLILRFADVSSGSILIDGQDIREVNQQSLRSHIAYVPQEAYLFHRSLRENVAYGNPHATDEEILLALERANAAEFVAQFANGLDTIVGERGVKLSGGQRQRIAIARAILKDAPILILDEATSALDSESEKLIQDALEKLMVNRTSIVIAHRLSTIAKLDRILVVDNGSLVEEGPHKDLVAKGGLYASLWSHQSGNFLEE